MRNTLVQLKRTNMSSFRDFSFRMDSLGAATPSCTPNRPVDCFVPTRRHMDFSLPVAREHYPRRLRSSYQPIFTTWLTALATTTPFSYILSSDSRELDTGFSRYGIVVVRNVHGVIFGFLKFFSFTRSGNFFRRPLSGLHGDSFLFLFFIAAGRGSIQSITAIAE